MGATFINIELEVRAPFALDGLAESFGEQFVANYCGRIGPRKYLLSGSCFSQRSRANGPDGIALALCRMINRLPPSAKKVWKRASDRVFDVGLDANLDRRVIVDLLEPKTLAQIAKVGARLAVSVYTLDIEAERTPFRPEDKRVDRKSDPPKRKRR